MFYTPTEAEQTITKNVAKMLKNRGCYRTRFVYNIDDDTGGNHVEGVNVRAVVGTHSDNTVVVVFMNWGPTIDIDVSKTYEKLARSEFGARKYIICYSGTLGREIAKRMKEDFRTIPMECIHCDYFMIDTVEHHLVPKHVPLGKSDFNALLKARRWNINDVPKMRYEDPVARYFGSKPGDAFLILRKTGPSMMYVFIRVVAYPNVPYMFAEDQPFSKEDIEPISLTVVENYPQQETPAQGNTHTS